MAQVHETFFIDGLRESSSDAQAIDFLALSRIKGLGDEGVAQLLAKIRSKEQELAEFYHAPFDRLVHEYGLRKESASVLTKKVDLIRQEGAELLEKSREFGICLLAPGDSRYPFRVEKFYAGKSPLLYLRGNLELLGTRCFALLNSSRPTSDGLDQTLGIARRLAEAGGTLVTGAEGAANNLVGMAAQQADANLVVVLHQGLFEVLARPERNPLPLARRIDNRIDWRRTLLLSPFRLDGRWQKGNGPRRDTLMVALADTLVGVQIRSGGLMDSLCRKARSLGRSVFVCQNVNPEKRGWANDALIQDEAAPLVGDSTGTNIDLILDPASSLCSLPPTTDDLERRRSLGQFFTPPEVAAFMWDMVEILRRRKLPRTARIVDLACGEGVFLRVAAERGHPSGHLFGVDIDETLQPSWASDPLLKRARIFRTNGLIDNPSIDFVSGSFDLVIGNPPFSGKGLKELLQLIEPPTNSVPDTTGELFASDRDEEKSTCNTQLPRHERAILDYIARQLSRYLCWRFREEPEANGEVDSEEHPGGQGLFADFHFEAGRNMQATDYDRMACLFNDWPANQLLDLKAAEMRQTIARLASTAIEVFFT